MRRFIKHNKGSRVPASLMLAAVQTTTETNGSSTLLHRLASVAVSHFRFTSGRYVCRSSHVFGRDVESLWEFIAERCNPSRTLTVIVNDAAQLLTLTGFWRRIDQGEWHQRWCRVCGEPVFSDLHCDKKPWRGSHVTSDPPVIISVRNSQGILRFLSASNYWNESTKLDADASWQLEQLRRLAIPCMEKWANARCGCWQTTLAGLSWTSWRHLMPPKMVVRDDSKEQIDIARAGYHGGQCEAYFIGNTSERVYKVDAHSFYGSIMRDELFPVAFTHMQRDRWDMFHSYLSIGLLPIATVDIFSQEQTYPLKYDGKLLFVRGKFTTTLAWPELCNAMKMKHVTKLHTAAWYQAGNPFKAWAEYWWNERCEAIQRGDKAREKFAKLILASLSGKLAAWSVRWKDIEYHNPPGRWHEWYERRCERDAEGNVVSAGTVHLRARAGYVQQLLQAVEGRDSLPAISAFITSYGRVRMEQVRSYCPQRTCFYQDTDGIIVNEDGVTALKAVDGLIGDGMGQFGISLPRDGASIHAQKDYVVGGKRTLAGVKRDARTMGDRMWEQINLQRLNGILCQEPREYTHSHIVDICIPPACSERLNTFDGWTEPIYWTQNQYTSTE